MGKETLTWAVFCALLVPMMLGAVEGLPYNVTVQHVALALVMVWMADGRERNG